MDDYPQHLKPRGNDTIAKEGFSAWWERAHDSFPAVPRNVARQWLHRHWGGSRFRWLPSHGAQFTLECWQPAEVAAVQIWREGAPPYADWGDQLLADAAKPKGYRPRLAWIMNQRCRWPAPPIVWHRTAPLANESRSRTFRLGLSLLKAIAGLLWQRLWSVAAYFQRSSRYGSFAIPIRNSVPWQLHQGRAQRSDL